MQAVAEWEGGHRYRVDDRRGHEVVVDLERDEGGTDTGTSSLELLVLSLAGCIATIFRLVAARRRIPIESLRIELHAERPRGAPTITKVTGHATIGTPASPEEVATVLRLTVRTCPVGALFEKAGVPVTVEAEIRPPERGTPLATAAT